MNRQEYFELIAPAVEMVAKKGADYNSNVKLEDYFPFGDVSYVQMIHLKAKRLISLLEVEKVNYESAEDTVLDMINYAVFYLAHLRKNNADV